MQRASLLITITFVAAVATSFLTGQTDSANIQEKSNTGIRVFVIDPAGAVIPKAKVRVEDHLGIDKKEGQTDESGLFATMNVRPDTYKVVVSCLGFRSAAVTGLEVTRSKVAEIQFVLQVVPGYGDDFGPDSITVPLEETTVSTQIEPRSTSQSTSKAKKAARTPAKPKP